MELNVEERKGKSKKKYTEEMNKRDREILYSAFSSFFHSHKTIHPSLRFNISTLFILFSLLLEAQS
jgi:hypothetical protein